jgi:hypothetical protein
VKKFRNTDINLSRQLHHLMKNFPHGKGYIKRNKLIWHCLLELDEAYGSYKIKLTYDLNSSPKIYVVSPDLYEITNGIEPPHIYVFNEKTTQLCLYLPSSGEWSSEKYLSDTMIPWTSLWLMYFTGWLTTGKWHGGGEHPGANESFIKGKVL